MEETNPHRQELRIMKLSSALTVLYAIAGIGVALRCDSMTMMLDALYGMADVLVSLLAVFVVRKIHAPPNERYPYGYAKYEPFMISVDGLLIAAICVAGIVTSVQDIVHPDPVRDLPLIIWYSFASVFICAGFGLYMRSAGKKLSSKILIADSSLWIDEGVISAGVCAAFFLTELIEKTYWHGYADYADPILCIILSLVLLKAPVGILRESFRDLVDQSPDEDVRENIRALALDLQKKHGLSSVRWIKSRRAGRRIFATLCFATDKDRTAEETTRMRDAVSRDLSHALPDLDVCIVFEV